MLYISDRLPLPQPSPARGRPVVHLPLLSAMKAAVYQAMTEREWRKADLARALGVNARPVDRLLDLAHQTPAGQIERARSEAHTSELQSIMRSSYAGHCLKTTTPD